MSFLKINGGYPSKPNNSWLKKVAKIIAISNPKGGVGKTTTAINLAASLAIAEKRVLLIDLDPNGALSEGLNFGRENVTLGVFDLFLGTFDGTDIIYSPDVPYLDLIPSNIFNNEQEMRIISMAKNRILLKKKLSDISLKVNKEYDIIIIDTPPAMGELTLSALLAAHSVLIPLQCGYFAIQVVDRLFQMIARIKKGINPDLMVEGIVLNFYEKNTRASKRSAEQARQLFKSLLYQTIIPKNTALSFAAFEKKPAVLVDALSTGAMAYLRLAQEFLEKNSQNGWTFENEDENFSDSDTFYDNKIFL